MDMLFWIKFRWMRAQEPLAHLYIIGVIIARIYADYFLSNFVEYFGDVLELPATEAASFINIRDGLAGIFGVIGALLLDVYFTHRGMTFLSSIFYTVGLGLVTYGDTRKGIIRKKLVLTGFLITGIGKFSLRYSSDALAEKKKDTGEGHENADSPLKSLTKLVLGNDNRILRFLESNENIILIVFIKYGTKILVIGVSTFTDLILDASPAAEKWARAKFLIPTIGFGFVPLMSFFYIKAFVKPIEERGTPLKHVIHVYVASILKRHVPFPQHPMEEFLYEENPEHLLEHTNSLRFLDKAAIVESTQPEEERRQWRLCTVTEVEETKHLLRMIPMCMTFLAYGMVKSIGNTFFLQQGNYMDSTLGQHNLDLPLQTLFFLADIASSGVKGLYILILSKKFMGVGEKYAPPIKYGIGLILATFSCTVAAWVANDKGQPDKSVFWLTPQFILFGAMSGVTHDGIESFFHSQLPPSMIRYASVFTDGMIGAGALFSIALVHATTSSNLDLNHLSRFYRLITVVSFVILSVYTFVAARFRYQDNDRTRSNEENRQQRV